LILPPPPPLKKKKPHTQFTRRLWAGMSAVLQHDITFGLLAAMGRALRVSPLELEGPESIRMGPHPAAR
jgi:hypothetical protein